LERRAFLKSSLGASAALALGATPRLAAAAESLTASNPWRKFEAVTRVEVANPTGVTRVWVPVPLLTDTDYFKRGGDTWTGNAAVTRIAKDPKYDVGLVYAEWPAKEKLPVLEITSRFATRDRAVDLSKPPAKAVREDRAILNRYLEPTKLIPTDGIVLETAQGITEGMTSDADKARALYEWIVENTFRDPKVRGCGLGDIKAMLDTRYFGGKCADLNALFVGLARAAKIPARDVYGTRCADSTEFKSLGKAGDISKAQHCRAEFYLDGYGWVPVDPADVRKVILEEGGGLPAGLADPKAQRARTKLFGAWEMNWLAYNYGHDVKLPNSAEAPVPFLMYPQAETAEGRKDSLDSATFKYQITAREVTS
jgi:transglutaminase-like putative cysteine protease